MIPNDPVMLLSYINTQLRDNYKDLDSLSEGLDISRSDLDEIVKKIEGIGYKYDPSKNSFT